MPAEQATCIVHIALWSQLGVLTRIYLDKFFTEGCTGGWGICLLSAGTERRSFGAYFPDLAANMLGCYVMGVLIASSTFGLPNAKAVALLPLGHPWQDAPELFIGLRTGYCGSLTTFASWEYALVLGLIGGRGRQGGQWAECLWGLIIGLQLSVSSYAFGGHCAAAVDRWIWRARERQKGNNDSDRVPGEEVEDAAKVEKEAVPRKYRLSCKACPLNSQRDLPSYALSYLFWGQNGISSAPLPTNRSLIRASQTTFVTVALLCVFTALWIVLAIVDSKAWHAARRQQWLAILLAPFGAILRWKLVTLHGKVPGWRWFPLGTFIANMVACCIDFALQAALQRANGLGYWVQLMFGAIRVGFSGALSTVSTFVAEIHGGLDLWPNAVHSYLYAGTTLVCGALSGIIIYGWSVWA